VPVKSQGITCFRVMRRQYAEAQNQFSNRFTETRPIRRARKAGANRERPHTLSRCDYRRPARNLAMEEARGFSAAMKQIGRRCTPKDSRAAGRVR
jgi:hypothetical protein